MHPKERLNALLAIIPGLFLFAIFVIIRLITRIKPPVGPPPPDNAITTWSHQNIYLTQVNPIFVIDDRYKMLCIGNYSFLSYCWYPYQYVAGFKIFRTSQYRPEKPFHQIVELLKRNPKRRIGIITDSGGPYGQVRRSLLRMAIESHRPIVMFQHRASRYFRIKKHIFPLPGATITPEFSHPIFPDKLKEMTEEQALTLLQQAFNDPASH